MWHVVGFVFGMLLSLAWNLPAMWLVFRYSAATAPRPLSLTPLHVLPGVVMFLCAMGLNAYQLARYVRAADMSASHCVTRRYARSVVAGLCTGLFGVWPLFLFGLWSQLTGWGIGLVGLPRLLAGLLVILWCGVCVAAPAPLTMALVAARPSGTGTCPNCGYDLRATAGRCPECGATAPPATEAAA